MSGIVLTRAPTGCKTNPPELFVDVLYSEPCRWFPRLLHDTLRVLFAQWLSVFLQSSSGEKSSRVVNVKRQVRVRLRGLAGNLCGPRMSRRFVCVSDEGGGGGEYLGSRGTRLLGQQDPKA